MEDNLEARINALERNQEDFGHDIRELKEQVSKLMKMVENLKEGKGVYHQEASSFPTQKPLYQGQPVLNWSNNQQGPDFSPSGSSKEQGLRDLMEEMDKLRVQVTEFTSLEMGSLSPTNNSLHTKPYPQPALNPPNGNLRPNSLSQPSFRPPNNEFRPNSYPQPPMIQQSFKLPNNNLHPNQSSRLTIMQPPFSQTPQIQAFTPSPIFSAPNHGVTHKQPKKKNHKKLDPIPISYAELFPLLVKGHLVAGVPVEPLQPPYPKWFNANARCDYHGGVVGHSIENCTAFKYRVQALIDAKWFDPAKIISDGIGKSN